MSTNDVILHHPYRDRFDGDMVVPHKYSVNPYGSPIVIFYRPGESRGEGILVDKWNERFDPIIFNTEEGA